MYSASMKQPLCRLCGKKISKKTRGIMFGRDGVVRTDGFIENRPERPISKEVVQALFNEQVVSVKWSKGKDAEAKKAGYDNIVQASVWDGVSYVDPYFCNGDHAKQFGYLAAEAGLNTIRYEEALRVADYEQRY